MTTDTDTDTDRAETVDTEALAADLLAPTWAELVATQNNARNFFFGGVCYSVKVYCEGYLEPDESRGETLEQIESLAGWEDAIRL